MAESQGTPQEQPLSIAPAEPAKVETVTTPPVDGTPPPPPAGEAVPEWVPPKFVKDGKPNYEALAKSYAELEKKIGQPPAAPDLAKTVIERAGLDQQALAAHIAEHGSLGDDHYEALAKVGIGKADVDAYMAGIQAQTKLAEMQVQQARQKAVELAGSQQQLNTILEWAKGLGEAEVARLNQQLASPATLEGAVRELRDRYAEATNSSSYTRRLDKSGGGGGPDRFETLAQLSMAMNDPRYTTQSDPDFVRSVRAKLQNTDMGSLR